MERKHDWMSENAQRMTMKSDMLQGDTNNNPTIMNYQDHIEITPGKRSGKPCLKGTRISVYDVLGWLANDMSRQEILDDYPELSAEHIQACLAYAAEREHHLVSIRAA